MPTLCYNDRELKDSNKNNMKEKPKCYCGLKRDYAFVEMLEIGGVGKSYTYCDMSEDNKTVLRAGNQEVKLYQCEYCKKVELK